MMASLFSYEVLKHKRKIKANDDSYIVLTVIVKII